MRVVVVGGGPAGMMAAIEAAKVNNEVILLEKMEQCGRKLLITGKGRCNITSSLPMQDFIKNVPGNGKFLFSVFKQYTNQDMIQFLKKLGVEVKEERGNRIFPLSDKSIDVQQAFLKELKKWHVQIITKAKVIGINVTAEKEVKSVVFEKEGRKQEMNTDKVVLATGGKSYPATGSTGDGYQIAEKLGHTIISVKGSLVPLEMTMQDMVFCKKMQGLSLRNIKMQIVDEEKKKVIYQDFGELLFTHFGVSGPTILSASAHLIRYQAIERLLKERKIKLYIDLKPALERKKLNERILRDFSQEKNKKFGNSLDKLLPQKLIPIIIEKVEIPEEKRVHDITREERERLVDTMKGFSLTISNFRPIEEAIVTSGGISVKEINPKTMASKLVKGLYFAGEIIDVDAYTGGFNLQIAYSTGYAAGKNG